MDRNDQILSLVLVLAISSAVIIAVGAGHLQTGSLAEWAGAAATTAAVVVALWTAGNTQRSERHHREALARVTAFRLAPHLVMMSGEIRRARAALYGIINQGMPTSMNTVRVVMEQLHVPTVIPLDVFADSWTLPPDIALAIAQLESRLLAQAKVFEMMGFQDLSIASPSREMWLKGIDENLAALERLATTVQNHTGMVSDDVVRAQRARRG